MPDPNQVRAVVELGSAASLEAGHEGVCPKAQQSAQRRTFSHGQKA
jgi:hypothetical protein